VLTRAGFEWRWPSLAAMLQLELGAHGDANR
jgi:hypothetical protein